VWGAVFRKANNKFDFPRRIRARLKRYIKCPCDSRNYSASNYTMFEPSTHVAHGESVSFSRTGSSHDIIRGDCKLGSSGANAFLAGLVSMAGDTYQVALNVGHLPRLCKIFYYHELESRAACWASLIRGLVGF
jgi:hypothetical protein